MPPPKSKSGVECAIDSWIICSLEKAKLMTWPAASLGLANQIIIKGRPPQNKKIFRYLAETVFKTWALMMALSMLLIISNNAKPKTTIKRWMIIMANRRDDVFLLP